MLLELEFRIEYQSSYTKVANGSFNIVNISISKNPVTNSQHYQIHLHSIDTQQHFRKIISIHQHLNDLQSMNGRYLTKVTTMLFNIKPLGSCLLTLKHFMFYFKCVEISLIFLEISSIILENDLAKDKLQKRKEHFEKLFLVS